ncbi:MAG: hypothetical protein JST86_01725 [Bacteroidetes bacterium]|nr:hypothetical protein [Bacteroidota bacterium]
METFYTAYTKLLDYKMYYFVKKFTAFPELKDVPPVLESYGMHTNFDKACTIAGITDATVKEALFKQAEENTQRAKVVELSTTGFNSHTVAAG